MRGSCIITALYAAAPPRVNLKMTGMRNFYKKCKKRLTNRGASVIVIRQIKKTAWRFTLRISFFRVLYIEKDGVFRSFRVYVEAGRRVRFYLFYFWRCFRIAIKEMQINEEIRDKEVRVVTDDGEQLGIMSAADALKYASNRNLDLVKIAPQATPPVCKVMDYGKYRFDAQKREKEARKNQKVIEIKEVQLSLNIDVGDLKTKQNHAIRFLKAGNKVKVSIRFRGREMVHPERGYEIMEQFAASVAEYGTVEKPAKMENRNMLMFLAAKPQK